MWGEKRPDVFILECFNYRWEGDEVEKVREWWGCEGEKGRRLVKVEKVAGWWDRKVEGFWFYSRVGDAKWVQDFVFLFLMLREWRGRMDLRIFAWPQGWKDSPYIFIYSLEIKYVLWRWGMRVCGICNCRMVYGENENVMT